MDFEFTELSGIKQADIAIPAFTHSGGDPARRAILESNHRMREGIEGGPRNFGPSDGFGRVFLKIPEFDYPFIRVMFPDVASPDAETRTKGWKRFARSPLSEPYRTERHNRGRG